MSARGFSLPELLIALTVSAMLAGVVAIVIVPARATFEATPATLDLQQRSRAGFEWLAATIRSAGAHQRGVGEAGLLGLALPAVVPVFSPTSATSEGFTEIAVVSIDSSGARGVLDRDQVGPASSIQLKAGLDCPGLPDVCGFAAGMSAAISDGFGRFDLFVVSSADPAHLTLTPSRSLSGAYRAGARVIAAGSDRFAVAPLPDGGSALVRRTMAGLSQPIVDGVVDLSFVLWGEAAAPQLAWDDEHGWADYGPTPPPSTWTDVTGQWPTGESCATARDASGPRTRLTPLDPSRAVVRLSRSMLEDGPLCVGGPVGGAYDVDLFRVRRVDISLRLEAQTPYLRGPAGDLFRHAGSAARAASRWVPDREINASIMLRNWR